MLTIGSLGFTAPWLLLGLLVLPILWILLRAVPPAPIRRRFPGVALLLGLTDDETQTDRTPWWLLLLRTLAIAAVIIGFAGPVLNPKATEDGDGPLLILLDATWADAPDWSRRMDRVEGLLADASAAGRETAVVRLTDLPAGELPFRAAATWVPQLPGFRPEAWSPDAEAVGRWAETLDGTFSTFWLSDGLDHPWREGLLSRLEARGDVRAFEAPRPVYGLLPTVFAEGLLAVSAVRNRAADAAEVSVIGHGLDPAGTPRELVSATLTFAAGETEASADLNILPELRNRITRFEISGIRSAGAVSLTDDALQRREVALIAGRSDSEGLELLSPTHYLRQALVTKSDLIEGALSDVVLANPDVIVLADVAQLSAAETSEVEDWVRAGGLLVRFAGPRLAASDVSRSEEDILMPVRLRAGGRNVGGAMSWGEPKTLRAFPSQSPFFGLPVPDEVVVTAQVMAQPDPTLADRVIASLADGTPLVTRKRLDAGQIVLFHVTANAEWSTLPLSGLFVSMLERLSISSRPVALSAEDLAGTTWTPDQVLTAFGEVSDAGTLPSVAGEDLAEAPLGAQLPPGLYVGEDRRIARNVLGPDNTLQAFSWPGSVPVEGLAVERETPLKGVLLAAALIMLMADIIASLWLSGRLTGPRAAGTTASLFLGLMLAVPADAQEEDIAAQIAAASEVALAYVVTGDPRLDERSEAGLRGLSDVLYRRTSIEPVAPIAVNLETDALSLHPFLYWPITPDQPRPSGEAYQKLNTYLRTGGLILFDTRDADTARFGATSPNARKLQSLALPLDIPPLEIIPEDHVLTRTFYLLQDFPGRHASRDIWVEAAPADAEQTEGMPFRNLNDNVTPVVIGGNDWASAWATDTRGNRMFPVGRGFAGERQREIAFRFGVNLIMHVLTGNYKSDQVHVPALLDRLGQ